MVSCHDSTQRQRLKCNCLIHACTCWKTVRAEEVQAGIVGSVVPPPKATVPAEVLDRATCLYETEWQIVEAATPPQPAMQLPKKRLSLAPTSKFSSTPGSIFVWSSSKETSESLMVSTRGSYQSYLGSFNKKLPSMLRRYV